MKPLFLLTLLFSCFWPVSCKKAIENKQREVLIDAITNGTWVIQQFKEDTLDITNQFSGYSFKFEENGAVHALYIGSVYADGIWTGDANNYTITSQFPTAINPVKKLNGTWKLTDSYWDYVEAEMTTPTGKNTLHLRKKP